MKILYLEFGGGLHAEGTATLRAASSSSCPLEALLRQPACADMAMMISSSWRESFALARLRWHLSAGLRERVVDVTPVLVDYDGGHFRYEKIKSWLDVHPGVERGVALDDDVEGFPAHWSGHVVFTGTHKGLGEHDLVTLQRLLDLQVNFQAR